MSSYESEDNQEEVSNKTFTHKINAKINGILEFDFISKINICIIILSWTVDWSVLCTSRSVFRALLLSRYPHPSSQCPIHHLYITSHEYVNVLTALSRAWGLELTCEQKIGSGTKVSVFVEEFLLLNHLIGSSTPILHKAFRWWKVPLSTNRLWSTLVFFYHLHRFLQRLSPSVSTTHHSPLTIKTPWEHCQRLLIPLVRFIVPSLPPASSLPSQLQM